MIEYLQTRLPAAPSRATLGPIIDKARLGVEREGLSFGQRIVVADSPAAGVWINRYGYLGDPKLASIGQLFGAGRNEETEA